MTAARKQRQVGKGMKPRGINADGENEIVAPSTDEGQQDSGFDGEMMAESETENPVDQIPISSQAEEIGSLQESFVEQADSTVCENVEQEGAADLEKMMKESEEKAAEPVQILESTPGGGDRFKDQYLAGVDTASGCDQTAIAELIRKSAGLEIVRVISKEEAARDYPELFETSGYLGEQPNGEYRTTVRIAEGYFEGVRQAAETDGISIEDWLTLRQAEYLENWFFAAGQK